MQMSVTICANRVFQASPIARTVRRTRRNAVILDSLFELDSSIERRAQLVGTGDHRIFWPFTAGTRRSY